jgi:multiple sugar transport system permease protein
MLCATVAFSQERIILRLTDWAGPDEMPLTQRAVKEFERQHPNIRVEYEPNPSRQYEPKILAELAAGEAPDVFLLDSKVIPSFTNKKILCDLTPYISKLNIDTTQWFPNVFAIARQGEKLYAFPKGFTPLMVYYNKKLLKKAGLPVPTPDWTWDDYLRYAQRLTKDSAGKTQQYGVTFTNFYFSWIPWIWTAGSDVIDPTGQVATGYFNSSATEKAFQFLIDLRLRHNVAPDVGTWVQAEKTGSTTALFLNDKIAMIISGHWALPKFLNYIADGALDIGVAPFPRHPNGKKVNVMYESGWCVPVSSRYPEAAADLASFLAGEVGCRYMAAKKLEIPSVRKVAEEAVAADSTGMEKMFLDEVVYCRQPWGSIVERFTEIEWMLQDAVDAVMVSGKPLHETFTEYAGRVDNKLSEIRGNASYEFKPIRSHSEIIYFLLAVSGAVLLGAFFLYYKARQKEKASTARAIGFLTPSLFHLTVFIFTPIIFSAYLSVHRWDIIVPNKPFVGLANFADMFNDDYFWNALKNTFIYALNVPFGMVLSLGVALLMHRKLKWLGFLRTLYFLPSVTSFVAISLVWMWIYNPQFGVANFFLNMVGLPSMKWLNSPQSAMYSVMLFTIWLGMGYQMIIFLAGLQGIPEELYEAARIDGANGIQRFFKITLPLLRPTSFFILVTSLISSFQVFTSIYVMTSGGPERSTDVIVYHIYQAAWEQLRMGYASAMAWVLFILIMFVTWLQFKFNSKDISYM